MVGYTSTPYLSSVQPCYPDITTTTFGSPDMHCQAGDVLTIRGGQFLQNNRTLTKFTIDSAFGLGTPPTCVNLTVLSDTMLCTLSNALVPSGQGHTFVITARFSDGNSTLVHVGFVYDQPIAPRVFAMEGCGQSSSSALSDGLSLRGCQQSEVLMLHGIRFERPPSWTWTGVSGVRTRNWLIAPTFACVNITVLSNTSLTCALPSTDLWRAEPLRVYPMIIYASEDIDGRLTSSNAFTLSFGSVEAPEEAASASTSEENVAVVASVASVLSVLAVMGLLCATCWVVRRRKLGQQLNEDEQYSEAVPGAWSRRQARGVTEEPWKHGGDGWRSTDSDGVELAHMVTSVSYLLAAHRCLTSEPYSPVAACDCECPHRCTRCTQLDRGRRGKVPTLSACTAVRHPEGKSYRGSQKPGWLR